MSKTIQIPVALQGDNLQDSQFGDPGSSDMIVLRRDESERGLNSDLADRVCRRANRDLTWAKGKNDVCHPR